MAQRFFVRIDAPSREALELVVDSGIDLIHGTFRRPEADRATVEALIDTEQLTTLVDEGLTVTVLATEHRRSRARATVGFDDWLAGMADDPVLRG